MLTAGAAAGLTGVYAAYAAAVTPLLAVPDSARSVRGAAETIAPPAANRELADRWLPHAPWAAGAQFQFTFGETVAFWNEMELIRGGKALRVAPFAMAVRDPGPADSDSPDAADHVPDRPTTLIAESATLQFERTVSTDAVAETGRVIGAAFYGAVRLEGPDGLRIDGENFIYKEKSGKLWSDRPAKFAHGGHVGEGSGVDVRLFRTRPVGEYDSFAADGVAEVEVAGPVSVAVRAGRFPGLDAAAADDPNDAPEPDNAAPGEPVRVTGTGPFTFDPHANTARFDSARGTAAGVRAWRDDPEHDAPDELTCDALTVRLEPAGADAKAEADAVRAARAGRDWGDRDFYAADDDLEPVAAVAEGSPGAPVRVVSPGRGATVTAGRLAHDLPADVWTLSSPPGVNGGAVEVRGPDARVRCPRLTVFPPEIPESGDPRRVRCEGPGELLRADPTTRKLAARVTWPGTLVTRRDRATGRDVVVLTGTPDAPRNAEGHTAPADQVVVENRTDRTFLSGDAVELHLEPAPKTAGAQPEPVAGPAGDANPLGGSVRPAFARAAGSVRILGPQLLAGAKSVEVTFEDPAEPEPVFADGPAAVREPGGPSPRKKSREPGGLSPRNTAEPQTGPGGRAPRLAQESEPAPAGPPSKFYADRVVASVVRPRTVRGEEMSAAYVRLAEADGGVGLFRTEDDGTPQYARAARAEVNGSGPGAQTLSLFGAPGTPTAPPAPATLSGSGAVLTGPRIDFDPAANTAEVIGGGAIDLPVKGGGMPGFAAADGPAPNPEKPGDPTQTRTARVLWGERMFFDGTVATFEGKAQTSFRGTQAGGLIEERVGLHCDRMIVTLTEPVVFGENLPGADPKPARTNKASGGGGSPEIELVTCTGRVSVEGRQTAPDPRRPQDGPVEAQRLRGAFAQLEVEMETGDFTAEGPGVMKLWRRDDSVGPRPTAGVIVRSNPWDAQQRRETFPCELIDVRFDRAVAGNMRGPDAVFHPDGKGSVTVLHGGVRDFGVALPDEGLAPGSTRLKSRTLELRHLPDPAGGDVKTRTLLASGGVEIDGLTDFGKFTADAPLATFNEAKGRLALSGPEPDSVRFFRSVTPNGERSQVTTRSADFFPARNVLELPELSGAYGLP